MTLIKYTPDLKILNTQFLAPGLGLRFLECIRSHRGELIAKMWHRTMPSKAQIVVEF